jgi:hypothetical protein
MTSWRTWTIVLVSQQRTTTSILGEGIIRLDVVGEGVLRQGHQHEITPEGIVQGRGVKDDGHQLANVWNHRSLDVEVGDDGCVV